MVDTEKNENHENREVLRGAGVNGIYTLGSRILGFIRDAVMAYYFGALGLMDVFVVAFRIPNVFRKLFAEGSLTIALIPVFTEDLKKNGHESARNLFDTIFTLVVVTLAILSILGVLFAPAIVWLFAAGFTNRADHFALAVLNTRICFPYVLLICLVASAMGVLNSLRHFWGPAAATMILNLGIILCVLFLPTVTPWDRLTCASVGVIVGGMGQLILQIPLLKRKGFLPRFRLNLKNPSVQKVLWLMVPAVFGSAVYQINILFMTRFASGLPEGSNSFLYYADRIFELPFAIFGISIATGVLPSLARQRVEGDHQSFLETFRFALRMVMFINLPAMVGLILLRNGIIQILFQSGRFSWVHTLATADALFYFSFGLLSVSGVRVGVAAFNALQDTATPVKIASASLFLNIFLCWILKQFMAHSGLALAVTLSSTLNFSLLILFLRKRVGRIGGRVLGKSALRLGGLALVMGVLVYILEKRVVWEVGGRSLEKGILLFAIIGFGMLFYLGAAKFFKFQEFDEFFHRRKKSPAGGVQ